MLWLNAASYRLTARERAVVDLVMRGFTTAQISATLCIPKYTIQEHLCSAFDKVGVRDRQALVKRLFSLRGAGRLHPEGYGYVTLTIHEAARTDRSLSLRDTGATTDKDMG